MLHLRLRAAVTSLQAWRPDRIPGTGVTLKSLNVVSSMGHTPRSPFR
jgi:hypothetical protein